LARPDLGSSVLFPPATLQNFAEPEQPVRLGDFAILSRLAIGSAYDDNKNATRNNRKSEISANAAGSVRAQSLFARHSLGVQADVATNSLNKGVNQDQFDLGLSADGRLDLTPQSAFSGAVGVTRGAQNPESQQAGASSQPTITQLSGSTAYTQRLRRLSWQLAGGATRVHADGGGDSEASQQDRTSFSLGPAADYRLGKRVSLFADTNYERNIYDNSDNGGSRDSQIVRANIGVRSGLGRTLQARASVGYIGAFFDDSQRNSTQSPAFNAALDGVVNLDRVTTLSVALNHNTDLTSEQNAALVTNTSLGASVSRSLSPISAISAGASFTRSDFIDSHETDDTVVAQLGYSRTLVRNVDLNIGYRYSQRFSNVKDNEFYRNIVSIGLSTSF
jgi:hypothetical protein